MKHFLIAGKGYIGSVHRSVAPIPASFLVRHLPESSDVCYTDFETAVQNQPLFFDICTPNDSHFSLCKNAAQHLLPIYCEKPLAANLSDSQAMLEAVTKAGLPNAVAFNYRFFPCVHLLKQALQQQGKIIYYKASFLHQSYLLPRGKVWRTSAAAGGGALADLGIHLFDLCNFIFGKNKLVDCEKFIEFPDRTEVDEYARCTLQSERAKGYLEISRISAGKEEQNGIEVFTHNGSLSILFDKPYELTTYDIHTKERKVITASPDLLETLRFPDPKHNIGMFYGSHKAAIETFISDIENHTKSDILADFADGVAAAEILEDALK